jgi:hypothetical protein
MPFIHDMNRALRPVLGVTSGQRTACLRPAIFCLSGETDAHSVTPVPCPQSGLSLTGIVVVSRQAIQHSAKAAVDRTRREGECEGGDERAGPGGKVSICPLQRRALFLVSLSNWGPQTAVNGLRVTPVSRNRRYACFVSGDRPTGGAEGLFLSYSFITMAFLFLPQDLCFRCCDGDVSQFRSEQENAISRRYVDWLCKSRALDKLMHGATYIVNCW